MSERIAEHLRRNVYGLIAIFIALGGSAIAANQAAKNSVTSKSIKNGQVKKKDLASNSVDSSKVVDDSLTGDDIDEGSLQGLGGASGAAGGDLAGTYPNPTIAANAVNAAKVADGTLTGNEIADGTLATEDIVEATLGFTAGADITGTLGNAQIATNAVGTNEVVNDSLSSLDVGPNAIGISEMDNNAVGSAEVVAESLTTADINEAGLQFSGGDITGNLGSAQIGANAVGAPEVALQSLSMADLKIGITDESNINLSGTINSGSCTATSDAIEFGVAPIGAFTLPYHVRLTSGAVNPGWTMDGDAVTTNNAGRIRICNNTGANADPPDLTFSYMTIAP